MKNTKKAFTLIEILVSCIILTIWVFWVYKLIWVNLVLLSNQQKLENMQILEKWFKKCLEKIWYNNLNSFSSWSNFSLNFWDNDNFCVLWNYDENFSFTWINLNSQNYYLFWNVLSKNLQKIDLQINVYNNSYWFLSNSWSFFEVSNY